MLRQKENRIKTSIDKSLISEVHQLNLMLKKLAKQQETNSYIQKLAGKNVTGSDDNIIHLEIVFVTEKKQSQHIKKILSWIGIDQKLKDENIFGGAVHGSLVMDASTKFKINMYHFDRYPIQRLEDQKKELKIIVYDRNYSITYKNWELALQVLDMGYASKLFIDISEEKTEDIKLRSVKKLATRHIRHDQLDKLLKEFITEPDFNHQLRLSKLQNRLEYIKQVYGLLSEDLEHKEKQLQGKLMLVTKKTMDVDNSDIKLSNRELNFLKSKTENEFKNMLRQLEESIDTLDKEETQFRQLDKEILSFLGFVESKSSKYVTLKIAEGAIQDKLSKSSELLAKFIESTIDKVHEKIEHLETTIQKQYENWGLEPPKIKIPKIDNQFSTELLKNHATLPDKPYEKQISYKGIGGLIMELRTPLFMLMPFMMIFALFGALVGGESKGHIDESVLFYDNRPAIAIDQLPESRGNEYRKFINEVESFRDPKKAAFDKEINSELRTEPQLAVKTIEVPQSFGNKTKTRETLDYHFDNKNRILYIFLKENADRNFVIEKLYDPSLQLLTVPSSTRRGFGIGGLIRALSGLKEYRYLILIGLVLLICWFVVTRKGSMDSDLKMAKEKEKQKLNSDLKVYIEKNTKQFIQKWRGKFQDELNDRQNLTITIIEKSLNENIEAKKQQKLQERKIVQKRLTAIKSEKTKLSSLKTEHRKMISKLELLINKLNRMSKATI